MYWYFDIKLAIFAIFGFIPLFLRWCKCFFVASDFLVYVDPVLYYLKLG